MGLFGANYKYSEEASTYLKNLMLRYLSANARDGQIITYIFSDANEMIKAIPEKKLSKVIKEEGICVEEVAINVLHNSTVDYMRKKAAQSPFYAMSSRGDHEDWVIYTLYKYINLLKYEKGFIPKKQYDDNNMLLRTISPCDGHITDFIDMTYERAIRLLRESDSEFQFYGRQMMVKMADAKGNCDPRVSMWMACEHEQNGNLNAAASWYEVASKQGVREAQDGYRRCYNPYHVDSFTSIDGTRGCGTPYLQMREKMAQEAKKDYQEAINKLQNNPSPEEANDCLNTIYLIASARGCCVSEAQKWMGDYFETVQRNNAEAVKWFKAAAENGNAEGMRCYADMLISGRGVKQDEKEAIRYYEKAADMGQMESMFVIGQHYYKNDNKDKAKEYFRKASDKGFTPAREMLEKLETGESIFARPRYQIALDEMFAETVFMNHLSDDGVIEFFADIYQPDDFCQKAFEYCNVQYAGKGEDRLVFEYNMTAFYGCICSVALWNEESDDFVGAPAWDAISKKIDTEFTDRHAEELLGTKNGEDRAEGIYLILALYMEVSKAAMAASKRDKEVCIYAMRLAYKLGMLVAKRELAVRNKNFVREIITRPTKDNIVSDDNNKKTGKVDFYTECVEKLHTVAEALGVASRGLIFIPELIPRGEKLVLCFLKDNFFQMEFSHDANAYYSFIMALSIDAGIVTAAKWHEDYSGLDDYVEKIMAEGPAEDANKLMEKYLPKDLFSNQGNPFFSKIYPVWTALHEPYWKERDPRDYTFKLMVAAYQLGVSVILEKLGY